VVQHAIDVFFERGEQGRIAEELRKVGLVVPGGLLADAAKGARGAIADQRDDHLHTVFLFPRSSSSVSFIMIQRGQPFAARATPLRIVSRCWRWRIR